MRASIRYESGSASEVSDAIVIQILLTLIRHSGAAPKEVVKYLRGHSPPILLSQVESIFARYALGEKGGS